MAPRPPAALLRRLEVLSDEPAAALRRGLSRGALPRDLRSRGPFPRDGADCCRDLRALAKQVRAAPQFVSMHARYAALADERRLAAASLVKRAGELCGCELQAALGLTHATVSHHMGALIDAGIVIAEKRGKWTHYKLAPGAAEWVP